MILQRLSTSGFGNTSATSPFASLDSSKSIFKPIKKPENAETKDQPQTSSSAFAASGFATHSASDKSPFGALGSTATSTKSGFGFGGLGSSQASVSSFGGSAAKSTLGASPFATAGQSGFGKLGGSGIGGAGGLTSFASTTGPGVLGSNTKSSRPFGAPAQEAHDSGDEDDTSEAGADPEERHEDGRFFEQKG